MARSKTWRIGTDRVVLDGDRLLVISRVEMEGWGVRVHRPMMIRFDDRLWRVAGKTVGADHAIHYELVPWTAVEEQLTGPEIAYDTDYVEARDRGRADGRRRGRTTGWLRLVSPFIGFLPAQTKARLETKFGVDPVTTTFQSVFIEFLVTVNAFGVASIGLISGGFGPRLFIVVGVVAAIDGSMRYARILGEERPPPGFYEWLFKRRR